MSLRIEIVSWYRWIVGAALLEIVGNLAFVFFEQAIGGVLGVTLKEDLADAITAGGEVYALGAARKQVQTSLLELLGLDSVVARVRYVKAGIDIAHQWMLPLLELVRKNTPAFAW